MVRYSNSIFTILRILELRKSFKIRLTFLILPGTNFVLIFFMNRTWKILVALVFIIVIFSIPTFLVSAGYVILPSNSSSKVLEEKYDKNYTKFKIDIDAYVTILEGQKDSIRIEAPQAFLKTIEIKKTSKTISVEKTGDTLMDLSQFTESSKPNIVLTMKNLDELEISGKAKVQLSSFTGQNLNVDFSSEASFSGEILNTKNIFVSHSGRGFISLIGTGENLTVNTKDSGRTLLRNFEVQNAQIKTEGEGGLELNVKQKLIAELNGTSPVRYEGSPKIEQTGTSGSLKSF